LILRGVGGPARHFVSVDSREEQEVLQISAREPMHRPRPKPGVVRG
jgi:hypothetical protein